MRDYKWLHEYCLNRFGSSAALEAQLPVPKTAEQLRRISDDRYLSTLALRVFRAGLKHSVVDAKWPVFEEVFFGFDPEKVVLMGAEHLERLMQDARIIRHLGKLKSVPRNAQMDGFEATARIRAELGLTLPVLAMTAGVMESEREQCIACGMNDFIAKPIDVEQMLRAIQRNLAGR